MQGFSKGAKRAPNFSTGREVLGSPSHDSLVNNQECQPPIRERWAAEAGRENGEASVECAGT